MPNILAIDISLAGISGDMFLAALSGLYENRFGKEELEDLIEAFLDKVETHTRDIHSVTRKPKISIIKAENRVFFGNQLQLDGDKQRVTIRDLQSLTEKVLGEYDLDDKYIQFATFTLELIIEAEEFAHNTDHVHLHELGTMDTVIDLLLPAIMLGQLGITKVDISPVALGSGTVKTAHGVLPVPVPAVDYIIQKMGFSTHTGPKEGEATTPTGIAILGSLQSVLGEEEASIWKDTSIGYGKRTWKDRENMLRLRLGICNKETMLISVLETNLDDVSGEILGYTMDDLMQKGALDVSYYPIFMKKNRPGYCLRVITKRDDVDRIAKIIMQDTGTLGIRILNLNRHIGHREISKFMIRLFNQEFEVSVKINRFSKTLKVEFEDLKRITEYLNAKIDRNISIKEIERLINMQIVLED